LAVDANGDVYVTGGSSSGYDNFDYATLKYSSAGVPLWTNRYNGPANRGDSGRAIAVGPSGDVYVSGWASGVFFATIQVLERGCVVVDQSLRRAGKREWRWLCHGG